MVGVGLPEHADCETFTEAKNWKVCGKVNGQQQVGLKITQ